MAGRSTALTASAMGAASTFASSSSSSPSRAPLALAAALLLLLSAGPFLATPASACGLGVEAAIGAAVEAAVPCGYVYPRLLIELGERGHAYELRGAQSLELKGNLTFTWDVTAEGLAAPNPLSPIVVGFQFPHKPDWLRAQVEPANLTVPIEPQYVQPSQNAAGAQLVYTYTAPITLHVALNGTPVLEPDQAPDLAILASSSESGLYKPGFGVRDLALSLPEAKVQQTAATTTEKLQVVDAQPLTLPDVNVTFEGATLTLHAAKAIELWKPAALTGSVTYKGQTVTDLDMAASVVDERNGLLYTTGLRHRGDGALPFAFTFPAPGEYRVLLAARPLLVATSYLFEPVIGTFVIDVPGVGAQAMRYPEHYAAQFLEPTSEFHANAQDLPRQYEKVLHFPVLASATAVSVKVELSTSLAQLGGGSLYAEVLGPAGDQLAFGKLDPLTPSFDVRLPGPLKEGDHRLRIYGTGLNPLGLGGTELSIAIEGFYPQPPVGRVTARGTPRPQPGGELDLGTGGMAADLVLQQAPALWQPLEGVLVVKDAKGQVALHPDYIVTVSQPDGTVLYTTGHRHPHDGVLPVGTTFPKPGLYYVSAFSGPTPEASGAFWQPAIVSWPVLIPGPTSGVASFPSEWHGHFHESTSSVRVSTSQGYAYVKDFAIPVLPGATHLDADLGLVLNAVAQHVDGAAPAVLTLELLKPGAQGYADPDNASVAAQQTVALAGAAKVALDDPQPGTWTLRVQGIGYAPLDYGGADYNLTAMVHYAKAPSLDLGSAALAPASAPPRGLPGFEVALLGSAVVLSVFLGRRRMRSR